MVNQNYDWRTNGYKREIQWKYFQYTLTKSQKVIWCVASIIIAFFISLGLSFSLSEKHYLTECWFIWVIVTLIEVWLQNKIWSEHFEFKIPVEYPWVKGVNGNEPPF